MLYFVFIKESRKKYITVAQKYKAAIVFNIYNKQPAISILKGFLKDHMTLKIGVMMLKIQFWHHSNKYNFMN